VEASDSKWSLTRSVLLRGVYRGNFMSSRSTRYLKPMARLSGSTKCRCDHEWFQHHAGGQSAYACASCDCKRYGWWYSMKIYKTLNFWGLPDYDR